MQKKRSNLSQRSKKKPRKWFIVLGGFIFLILVIFFSSLYFLPHEEAKKEKKITKKTASRKKQPESKEKVTSSVVNNKEIDQFLEKIGFSGTAMIVRNGKVILNKGYLNANREEKNPNTPDTLYYIGSSQKAFTAAAILQLADQGKLKIDDPISKYFPAFPNGQTIKLKNLLNHTSGIVGHSETKKPITPSELVQDIEKRGIKRGPGKWEYKDSNYTVLSYLVEKVSGMKLDRYLEKNVFKPAKMTQVGFYNTFNSEKNKSIGYYVKKDGNYSARTLPELSQLYGVGNMYMSAQSMYLFDKAIMERKLFSEESFRQMFTKGSSSGYGMGFYNDPGSYNSHGVMNGFNVSNSFSKTGKTYVVLFSNVQNNIKSFGEVNNKIYQLLNKAEP